jgi:hypothetical protein
MCVRHEFVGHLYSIPSGVRSVVEYFSFPGLAALRPMRRWMRFRKKLLRAIGGFFFKNDGLRGSVGVRCLDLFIGLHKPPSWPQINSEERGWGREFIVCG